MLRRFLVSRPLLFMAAALLALAAGAGISPPRTLGPAAADITIQQLATGIGPITTIANAGDSRLFLTVQTGTIVVFSGGQIQPSAFLDLSSLVSCCSERGL